MPTRITQIERPRSETSELKDIREKGEEPDRACSEAPTKNTGIVPTVFKVEGTLNRIDAELLEKICRDVGNQTQRPVTLELAGISYLDSESAAVLCRMKREQNVNLEGLHLFIGKVVELAEECEKASKYLPKPKHPLE